MVGCALFQRGERVITGSGRVTSETRAVAGIERVALEGLGEVMVQEGAAEARTIAAEDNILPLITSVVEDGALRLGFDRATWRDSIRPTEPIRYVLIMRDLQAFELSGSGNLSSNRLHADSLTINISGSGDVNIKYLEANRLDLRIAGTGDVTLAGQVGELDLEIGGSGQYQAGELDSQTVNLTISGSGDAVL